MCVSLRSQSLSPQSVGDSLSESHPGFFASQGNKINPFADGVSERKYIIREEVHGSMTTSLSFVMNYGDGKWSVKKNNVKS